MRFEDNRSLRALAGRNFRIYFTGQIVSTIGTWMQLLAQSWLVLQLTHSGVALGLNVTLQTLPLLVFGVWAGGIADRVDNRKLLVVTAALGMVQALGLGVLVATGSVTTAWVYLFSFFFGMVFAFERPAANALLFELVGPADLPSAVGLNSVIQSAGRLAGPAIGGVVIATSGLAACCFANAASFLAVIGALMLLRRGEMFARIRHADRKGHLRAGLRYVRERQDLRVALVVMAFVGIFAYNFMVLVPSMVKFEFHAGPGALGLVQAVSGVGSVIGGLVIASVGRPTLRLLGMATVAFGLLIAGSAAMPELIGYAIIWLPLGAASSVFSAVDQMVLQHGTAPEFQGRVMSLFAIAWWGTTPIGSILTGVVVQEVSPRAALMIGAASALLAGSVVLWMRRRIHAEAAPA
jgi:MFS family permease